MTKAIMRRSVLCVGMMFAVAGGAHVSGWLPAQDAGTVLDFRVLGADGQPVKDLKPDEVTIRIAGRPRPIKSLRLVETGGGASGAAAAPAAPPPFGSNADGGGGASGGRVVLIVVEDESLRTGGERQIIAALTPFLDSLSPADKVAFSIAPRDTANAGFGAGLPQVKAALAQLTGRQRPPDVCRTRDTLLHLRNLLAPLAGTETPVTVLFFSTELSSPQRGQTSTGCDLTTEHYQGVAQSAAAARAQFYVINSDVSVGQRNDGLETLAGVTGAGTVVRLAGQDNLLGRIAAETSAHYLATVDAEASDRAGQGQRFEVRVSRDNVTAKFRPEVVFTRAAAPAAGAKPGAAVAPIDMLRTPGAFRDLPVRTMGVASRDTDGRIKVAVFSEPIDPTTKLTGAAVALIDASNKFAPTVLDQKQVGTFPIVTAHSVAPGKYRLRFAAVDASGKSGAADFEINAALTDAGPLKLSGLMLTGLRNNSLAPQLQFTDEATAVGYLEIYGQLTGQVGARMEVAATLDGPAIETIQPGGQQTKEADKFVLTGQIPLAALKPGDYVVRAIVGIQGQPEGRVVATLRKVAK